MRNTNKLYSGVIYELVESGGNQMLKKEFTVDVTLFNNGTLVATSKDILGLVLEVDSFDELREELLTICPILLVENHGLTEDDFENVLIRADVKKEAVQISPTSKQIRPALIVQEDSSQISMHA